MSEISVASLAERLDRMAGVVDTHLRECGEANRAQTAFLSNIADRLQSIETLPMKAIKWIAGIVGTAVITLVVQNFYLHEQTAQTARIAAVQATEAKAQGQAIAATIGAPIK